MMHCLYLTLVLVLLAPPVWACSCPDIPLADKVKAASFIFQGTVVYPRPDMPPEQTSFRIDAHLKGRDGASANILRLSVHSPPACAATFELGKTYLVLAEGTYESGYTTDACHSFPAQITDDPRALEVRDLRLKTGQSILHGNQIEVPQSRLTLEKIRTQAKTFYLLDDNELALRLYVTAAARSHNSPVDLLGQGHAYLRLMMADLALQRFDDVLEKDSQRAQAWSGRYQALALLGRWSEIPEKANLSGLWLRYARIPVVPVAADFSTVWWREIDAAGLHFKDVSFRGATLSDVNFSKSNLENVDFTEAVLHRVDFSGAKLSGVKLPSNLNTIIWDETTQWPKGFDPAILAISRPSQAK